MLTQKLGFGHWFKKGKRAYTMNTKTKFEEIKLIPEIEHGFFTKKFYCYYDTMFCKSKE